MTTSPQNKEVGGSNAEAHIDGSLWLAVVAIGAALLSYGTQHGNEKAVDQKLEYQDLRIADQDKQIADQKKEIMLLREDVRELTIELRGKQK